MTKYDTFLSYSSLNQTFVNKLKDDLIKNGITVWLDQDKLVPGDVFVEAIEKGLDESRTICIVVSPESMRSDWVREEYLQAFNLSVRKKKQLRIIPILLKNAEMPSFLSNRQWVDFRDKTTKYANSLAYLIRGIRYIVPLLPVEATTNDPNEMLQRAKQTLIVSGHTLDKFTEQLETKSALIDAIRNGVQVSLILINPFCDYSRAHEPFHMLESRSPSQEQITNSIQVLYDMFNVMNQPKNLTVLLSNYMPKFRTIIIDDAFIHISLYMYGVDVGTSPDFTFTITGKGIEQNWFDTIITSTHQLVDSRHVIPVIRDGVFHQNWRTSKHAFQMRNCLSRLCCKLGDNCWHGIQHSLLGYQNPDGEKRAISEYNLVDEHFNPGTFTLSDINKGTLFLVPPTTFDDWLRNAIKEEFILINENSPDLLKDIDEKEIMQEVKQILTFQPTNGKTIRETTCYQEFSDILHRIIMTLLTNYPDYEIDLFKKITVDKSLLILDVIDFLERDKSLTLADWLHLSIAAGLIGIDNKTVNAATSEFDKTVGISIGNESEERDSKIQRIAREIVNVAHTQCRIDASDFFFHILDTNYRYPLKIVSFPDDFIESLFLLKFYELLLNQYKMVSIDFIPKSVPCSNDLTYNHAISLLHSFQGLANNIRFKIVPNGPKTGGVNIFKLNEEIWRRIGDAFIIDVRGARNYEMLQGIKKQAFFGFMVCRDFSVTVSGLTPHDSPLVFIRQLQGEYSYEGFKQRHLRIHSNKYLLARKTIADNKYKWEGGHLSQIGKLDNLLLDRWNTLVKFYSNYALDFDKKWGKDIEIESEVTANLDKLSGKILVLGCGSGKEVSYLAKKLNTQTVFGLDISSEAILIARMKYPNMRENFFVEDIYNVDHIINGEFDSIVANASLLHLLRRDDLQFILQKIQSRLRVGGLLYIRLIHKLGYAPLSIDDPSLSITQTERELLKGYIDKSTGKDMVDVNELIPLLENKVLNPIVFQWLLSNAQPLKEEIDGRERGEDRWFVYFTPDELRDIAIASGYKLKKEIEVHPHHSVLTVKWLSVLLEKT